MIVQRLFSIQSGGPDVGGSLKRELSARTKAGAVAGGVLGGVYGTFAGLAAGIGDESAATGFKVGGAITAGSAVLGAIVGALTALGANSRRAKAEGLDMNSLLDYLYNVDDYNTSSGFKTFEDVKINRYIVEDGDPNKFMVNFGYEDGKLVINLNNPSDKLIRGLNEDLEGIVKFNRKADYAAQSVDNGFMVYVICPSIDSAAGIIYNIVAENKIKVNALTEKSLSKYKIKSFSDEEEDDNDKDIKSGKRMRNAGLAIGGAGVATSVGGTRHINKALKKHKDAMYKVADKTGSIYFPNISLNGPSTGGTFHAIGFDGKEKVQEKVDKAAKMAERYTKSVTNKAIKRGNIAGFAGFGAAVGGASLAAHGANKKKKAERKKNEKED